MYHAVTHMDVVWLHDQFQQHDMAVRPPSIKSKKKEDISPKLMLPNFPTIWYDALVLLLHEAQMNLIALSESPQSWERTPDTVQATS